MPRVTVRQRRDEKIILKTIFNQKNKYNGAVPIIFLPFLGWAEPPIPPLLSPTLTGVWVGITAVVVIIISSISLMLSQGNTDKVARAKRGITYSIIGLLVTLAAFAIVTFILGAIG